MKEEELWHPEKFCEDQCGNISQVLVMKKTFMKCFFHFLYESRYIVSCCEVTKSRRVKKTSHLSTINLSGKLNNPEQSRESFNNQIPYMKILLETVRHILGLFFNQNTCCFCVYAPETTYKTTSVIW